jgi:hypothetical protein
MANHRFRLSAVLVALAVSTTVLVVGTAPSASAKSKKAKALVGTFAITAGSCDASGTPSGSYFTMVNPGGTAADGPFFPNADSACADKSFTLAGPGTDGGLVTGAYQPQPTPAFDANGDSLATRVITPQTFVAIAFGVSSNPVDPQTQEEVPEPKITVRNGKLSGDLRAVAASWNNQQFNQGSPKPDGSKPGITSPVKGTYDPKTKEFVLEWASQIVSGPFNDFTGVWHLEGVFTPGKKK